MSAIFTYAARYAVQGKCVTPLRTGGAEGRVDEILQTADGQAFLQGSSLAGALRAWLEKSKSRKLSERLFGSQETAGKLMVSDVLFAKQAERTTRPRLRIDAASGTAAKGAKFDVTQLTAGTTFQFELTLLEADKEKQEAVRQMLSALNLSEIRLGGQKSNGFGEVSVSVKLREFDMHKPDDRDAWLADAKDGRELQLTEQGSADIVRFTLQGKAENVLVKAPSAEHKEEGSCTRNLTENGCCLIPGSSVKGSVKARVLMIADYMGIDKDLIDERFGRGAGEEDNGKPCLMRFSDVQLDSKEKKEITRIRINRFTGGVIRGGLFKEEPVCAEVLLRIQAPNDPIACGLLLYALRDLCAGQYSLGSGASIGRGILSDCSLSAELPTGEKLTIRFDRNGCRPESKTDLAEQWLSKLEEVRHES